MSHEVEGRIAALAARQHGAMTQRQLLDAGLSTAGIARRLRAGRMRRLHRGVYLVSPFPLEHTGEMAAVLATPGGALSHRSAGHLWGAVPPAARPRSIEVSVVGHRGRLPGITVHRVSRLGDDERTRRHGIPITTVARTLVDLAGVLAPRDLELAAARVERAGLITLESIEGLPNKYPAQPGIAVLQAVLRRPGGPALTHSDAEEVFLALVREGELPPPECNVSIGRYQVDFLWRAEGVVVEVDGYEYHAARERFENDRRRDADLEAAGLTVVRFTWRQITEAPTATAVRVGQILVQATARR